MRFLPEAELTEEPSVPSGASTGKYEACELRDKGDKRFQGKGVFHAVRNVTETIAPQIMGLNVCDQKSIDSLLIDLDNTQDKSRLGSNALLGVSLAVSRAAAEHVRLPLYRYLGGLSYCLPVPFINVINGGLHAANKLDFQEFMIVPVGALSFFDAMLKSCEVFYCLGDLLTKNALSTNVGDEGGFAPSLSSVTETFDYLSQAVEKAGYRLGDDFGFALDVAATELVREGKYHLEGEGKVLTSAEMVGYLTELTHKYPLISIEDGLSEEDVEGFSQLVSSVPPETQVVGDDLIVTNSEKLARAISKKALTCALIKPNQVGTLSETLDCVRMAHQHGMKTMISHRSGETEDPFISDLCVAVESGQIKTGSLSRSERTSKYNQLLRIEEELGEAAEYGRHLL